MANLIVFKLLNDMELLNLQFLVYLSVLRAYNNYRTLSVTLSGLNSLSQTFFHSFSRSSLLICSLSIRPPSLSLGELVSLDARLFFYFGLWSSVGFLFCWPCFIYSVCCWSLFLSLSCGTCSLGNFTLLVLLLRLFLSLFLCSEWMQYKPLWIDVSCFFSVFTVVFLCLLL
jgi:hypothetical protein